ncbi:DUF2303 family protein [Frigidibacter sp. MR17.24]|uniref:DUF2303 family protein n=1 Tax=Frigidibacter sp. MR17.24 TaxID=3127345 RepID=UPI003012EDC4
MPPRQIDQQAAEPDLSPIHALDAAIDAARKAQPLVSTADGREFALIHDRHELREIQNPHRLPPFVNQRVTLDTRRALVDYANRFRDGRSIIVADYTAGKIHAYLDWHRPGDESDVGAKPEACKHVATLAILPSEEWTRWDKMEGALHPQATFAAFLDENSVDIAFPEAATMVEISRDLEATTGQSFKSSTRLENGDRAFRFETETRVTNQVTVPTVFMLNIPLYEGEGPMELRAAFRYRPTPEGLLLGFEWRRVEYQRRAHFAEIATKAAEDTGLPVFLGRAT